MAQTPKRIFANISSSTTDGALISAVSGKALTIVSAFLVAGATATNVTFNSKGSGAGTAITCLIANGANGGAVLNYNEQGWFNTNTGEGLTCTTGGGSTVGIQLCYLEI